MSIVFASVEFQQCDTCSSSVLETETLQYFKMSRKGILKYLVWQLSVVLIHSKSMNTQVSGAGVPTVIAKGIKLD